MPIDEPTEPYLGELRLFSFGLVPKDWKLCDGATLRISENQALFSLLGTRFGGDGQTTFALPDLRGRVPRHMGNGWNTGQAGGAETHTLTMSQMPQHNHVVYASTQNGDQAVPNALAAASDLYASFNDLVTTTPATITNAGGSQAHLNLQPYLTLSWYIAVNGAIFPSQT